MWGNVEQFKNNVYLTPLFKEAQASMIGTVDSKYLLKRLQEFQMGDSFTNKSGKVPSTQTQSSSQAALTLYHDGSMDSRWYRLKEISERLNTLESLVGPAPENMSNVKGGMNRNVEYLAKRLELLCDQNRLSTLKRRVDALKEACKDIKSVTQSTLEEQITKSKEHKINQMFEMMERWDQASHALPAIVNRLRALQNLHQESADMLHKVNGLESQQHLIAQTLEENAQLLQQVSENLSENSKTMQANAQSVDQRITQLQQQIQKL